MSQTFKNAVLNTPVEARTENGMKALHSTLSATTDLFFKIGASRGKDIVPAFETAFQEDADLALRVAQWARDVRGGAGERQLFRDILCHLELHHPDVLLGTRLLENVAELGRWDDLLIFGSAPVKNRTYQLIARALAAENGLCAKWMPRKGSRAVEFRKFLGLSPRQYRKLLVKLTKVVETQMCQKQWSDINFSHVPSLAMSRYTKAFGRNAETEFTAYKEALKKGDPSVKINAGAVYPYDVIKTIRSDHAIADQMWEALPNYMGEDGSSMLAVVDVSGSMGAAVASGVSAMDVAISLGLYTASKNKGAFSDLFLTFSSQPQFVHLKGTLSQRYTQMSKAKWDMSTNLHGAFNEILRVATTNHVPAEEMPKILLILSDMQFNVCVRFDDTAIAMIRRKYEEAGYQMPAVVFWNINSHDNVPVKFDEKGVALVSGFSPSIVKSLLSADINAYSPEAIMRQTVMSDRYNYN